MKKYYTLLILLLSFWSNAQNGITYQAVILNPNTEELPGADNSRLPLVNQNITLEFKILNATSNIDYQETINTLTDAFGMVNVIIGTGTRKAGIATQFSAINWDGSPKTLIVALDPTGDLTHFIEISNQPFTYVPYALYAAHTGVNGTQGPAGSNGLDGKTVLNGTTNPSASIGTNGDFYINTTTNSLFGPKANGLWGNGVALVGPQGIQGPQGNAGTNGTNGLSAYQIWLNAGNTGTEAQFLTALRGATGAQGPQGIQGVQGATGLTGATGPQGPAGTNGINGSNGSNGLSAYQIWLNAGNTGTEAQFLTALRGATGTQGPQGIQGVQGPTGLTGATGPQGPAGSNGTNGSNGSNGLSAYQIWLNAGNTGTESQFLSSLQGLQGIQGPQGSTGYLSPGNFIGEIRYWNSNEWHPVPSGTNGQVLTLVNNIPQWQTLNSSNQQNNGTFFGYILPEPQDAVSQNSIGLWTYNAGGNFNGFGNSVLPNTNTYANDMSIYIQYPGWFGNSGNFISNVSTLSNNIRQSSGSGIDSNGCNQGQFKLGSIGINTTQINPLIQYSYSIWIPLAGVGGNFANMNIDVGSGSPCSNSIANAGIPDSGFAAIDVNVPSGCAIPSGIYRVLWLPQLYNFPNSTPLQSTLWVKGN